MIHFLLTPIMLFSSVLTEIVLNENHIIKGIVVTAETQVDQDLMAVTPGDWILMKGLIESNDGECKAIINDGIAIATAGSASVIKDFATTATPLWDYVASEAKDPGGLLDIKVAILDAAVDAAGSIALELFYVVD